MSIATQKIKIVKIILNKSIFDENIINIILQYYWNILDGKKKILLNWIDKNNLDWTQLSANPNAIDLLKIRIEYEKSLTPEEYNKLEERDKINWWELSANPNAIELLKENQNKIDWEMLSLNSNAIDLLKERIEYENSLTDEEFDQLQNKINWTWLSENPNAIELLINNQDKINWTWLSENSNAIELLKENQHKINWSWLSKNLSIFKDEPMPII